MGQEANKVVDFDSALERIFNEVPGTRELWEKTGPKRNVANMLASVRAEYGLSKEDVAERAGWTKSYVSRLEGPMGKVPDIYTIGQYVNACGTMAWIAIGDSPPDDSLVITGNLEYKLTK